MSRRVAQPSSVPVTGHAKARSSYPNRTRHQTGGKAREAVEGAASASLHFRVELHCFAGTNRLTPDRFRCKSPCRMGPGLPAAEASESRRGGQRLAAPKFAHFKPQAEGIGADRRQSSTRRCRRPLPPRSPTRQRDPCAAKCATERVDRPQDRRARRPRRQDHRGRSPAGVSLSGRCRASCH